jgi:two-component system, sensor histidine kinase
VTTDSGHSNNNGPTKMRQLFSPEAWRAAQPADRSRVLREQTDLLIRQSRTGLITALLMASLLGLMMFKSSGPWMVGGWLLLMTAGYVLRQWLMERAQASGSLEDVLRITVVGAALLALIITAPGPLAFPYTDEGTRALLTMVHLVWATAAVTVLGVFPPSYKVYVACSFFNIGLGWWLSADRTEAALITAGLVLLSVILTRFSGRVGKLIEESVNIRHEREVLVARLQESLAETESAQLARSRFLASASHDLLQPVHALLLLTSLSRELPEGPRREDVLKQLHTTAESIDSMFRGLLDLARFDAGTVQPQLTSMPVAHVLRSVQAAYQSRCAEKGVTLTVETPPGLYVHADPALFDRIVRNLVDNAVKFTPKGEIVVRCGSHSGLVQIEVQDSGVGIAENDLVHVQEAFYRGASAREVEADGVGLGLANSTQMALLLHGELTLQSAQGQGTTARLVLPAGQSPQGSSTAAPRRKELRYGCIVLVEDDRSARRATEMWLQDRGVTVVATADVQAALDACAARALKPDYLLCDYKLADNATGVQAIQALRQRFGAVPAAIISGESLAGTDLLDGVPLLPKPLRPERLEQLLS